MAAPRAPNDVFLRLPFRRSESNSPDWRLLEKYIKHQHPGNWNTSIQSALTRLTDLKKTIASICREEPKIPPNEAFIETTLKPYISLICFAQIHLPLCNGTVKNLTFEWRDSLDDNIKHYSPNSNVEVWSCLYNLGASLAYVATVDAQSGVTEHIKRAYQTFQAAAGAYQAAELFLKRVPPCGLVRDTTIESLNIFQKICLAQAHHCGYLKALHEVAGKHGLKAKLAATGSKQYETLSALVRAMNWPKGSALKAIESYLSSMQHALAARAEMHLGDDAYDEKEIGEAVARFSMATVHADRIGKMPWSAANRFLDDIKQQIAVRRKKANSENDTVYFARVPKDLAPCEPLERPLGKITSMEGLTKVRPSREGDPFFGIVPAHVVQVTSLHFARVQEKVALASRLVTTYREKVRNMTSSLGVSGAIESLSSETKDRGKIPEPLRGKIIALKGTVEMTTLFDALMSDVQQASELHDAVVKRTNEIFTLLSDEAEKDAAKERTFGTLIWRKHRKPSSSVPQIVDVTRAVVELKSNTVQSLEVPLTNIKATMNLKMRELCRLDFCLDDLDALMPYTKTKQVQQQTQQVVEAVEDLKNLQQRLEEVDESLSQKLNEANACLQSDDVVHTLSAVEPELHDSVLEEAMLAINDILTTIQSSTTKGEELLDSLQESMTSLATKQSEDPIVHEIQQVLSMLELALHTHMSLRQDATTAATCASQLLERGEGLLQQTQSICMAREFESNDITEILDREIAQKVAIQLQEDEANESRQALQKELAELEHQQMLKQQQRAQTGGGSSSMPPPPTTAPIPASPPVQPPPQQQQPAYAQPPPQQQQQQQQPYAPYMPPYQPGGGYAPPYGPPPPQQGSYAPPPQHQQLQQGGYYPYQQSYPQQQPPYHHHHHHHHHHHQQQHQQQQQQQYAAYAPPHQGGWNQQAPPYGPTAPPQ